MPYLVVFIKCVFFVLFFLSIPLLVIKTARIFFPNRYLKYLTFRIGNRNLAIDEMKKNYLHTFKDDIFATEFDCYCLLNLQDLVHSILLVAVPTATYWLYPDSRTFHTFLEDSRNITKVPGTSHVWLGELLDFCSN